MMSLVFVDGPLNNELLEAEFEGREIDKRDLFAFYNRRINFLWTRASLRNQLLVTATVSTAVTFPIQDPSFQLPDGSQVSIQDIRYFFND